MSGGGDVWLLLLLRLLLLLLVVVVTVVSFIPDSASTSAPDPPPQRRHPSAQTRSQSVSRSYNSPSSIPSIDAHLTHSPRPIQSPSNFAGHPSSPVHSTPLHSTTTSAHQRSDTIRTQAPSSGSTSDDAGRVRAAAQRLKRVW
ncbi:hypothetical protein JOL62DRAFT_245380 [Phyllosticta paracitricarpa]|uniref:Uncharacterized protein n=1 Tax=Phyllosticta paracitricarpa TaxID=2016321 RepID=A0ABR1MZV3_9PEZI